MGTITQDYFGWIKVIRARRSIEAKLKSSYFAIIPLKWLVAHRVDSQYECIALHMG